MARLILSMDGLVLKDPETLLTEWSENAGYRKNAPRNCYTLKSIAEIEADLAKACAGEGIQYALTGFSGAARYAPSVRYQRAMAYVSRDVERIAEKRGAALAASLHREEVEVLEHGAEVPLGRVSTGQEVTAQSDHLIVRCDRRIELDHLEPRADFRFELSLSKLKPHLGERIQVRIVPKQESIAPLVRLYLPGCLAFLKGGANAQSAHLPITGQELVVEAIAVRPGRGRLFATVHDMYDADMVGTLPGIEVTVQ